MQQEINSMKLIRKQWLAFYQKVLGGLLVMLGFSGCDNIGADMYGTPYADFSIKGTVADEDGKPIPSATVIIRDLGYKGGNLDYPDLYIDENYNNVLTTDSEGQYGVTRQGFASETLFRIVAKDASHESDSLEVTLAPPGSNDTWYEGEAKETVNITLKKKNEQD